MFKKVAGKREIDLSFYEASYLNCGAEDGLHSRVKIFGKLRPRVESNSPARNDFINERAISATNIKDAIIWSYLAIEVISPQSSSEDFPADIRGKPNVMIGGNHLVGRRHSEKIPIIIRKPTVNARRLLTLPPLLSPTRGWKVTGHSTTFKPYPSARSIK